MAECEEVIQLGEDWGIGEEDIKVSEEMRIRTSNRTNSYCNEELTTRMNPRLPEELLDAVEASTPYTSVRGIHPNWRVARYQEGQTFPAHQVEWTSPLTVPGIKSLLSRALFLCLYGIREPLDLFSALGSLSCHNNTLNGTKLGCILLALRCVAMA